MRIKKYPKLFLTRNHLELSLHHPGKWMKYSADNIELWNCCGNEVKISQVNIIIP